MTKLNYIKNKNRAVKENIPKYTPNYQSMDLEPMEYKSGLVPSNQPVMAPNLRVKRGLNQPYAKQVSVKQNTLPNTGNNMEHSWSSVDGEVIGEDGNTINGFFDPNQPIVDNNDFSENTESSSDLLNVIKEIDDDSYLLIVKNIPICSGPSDEIRDQVQALVLGEHELCQGEPMNEDNILVLKKISIRVGVTLG